MAASQYYAQYWKENSSAFDPLLRQPACNVYTLQNPITVHVRRQRSLLVPTGITVIVPPGHILHLRGIYTSDCVHVTDNLFAMGQHSLGVTIQNPMNTSRTIPVGSFLAEFYFSPAPPALLNFPRRPDPPSPRVSVFTRIGPTLSEGNYRRPYDLTYTDLDDTPLDFRSPSPLLEVPEAHPHPPEPQRIPAGAEEEFSPSTRADSLDHLLDPGPTQPLPASLLFTSPLLPIPPPLQIAPGRQIPILPSIPPFSPARHPLIPPFHPNSVNSPNLFRTPQPAFIGPSMNPDRNVDLNDPLPLGPRRPTLPRNIRVPALPGLGRARLGPHRRNRLPSHRGGPIGSQRLQAPPPSGPSACGPTPSLDKRSFSASPSLPRVVRPLAPRDPDLDPPTYASVAAPPIGSLPLRSRPPSPFISVTDDEEEEVLDILASDDDELI